MDLKLEQVTWEVGAPLQGAALAELFSVTWHGRPPLEGVLARSLCWVSAQLNGELIGFVNVAWDGGSHAFLLDPTVHPKHQRRGLGVALVQRAADEARRRGVEWLSVDFEPHLSEFYRRCGFRPSTAGVMHLNPPASTPVPRGAPSLEVNAFEARWLEPCRELILGLPEWFGIPSANAAYLADLSRVPSWVATLSTAAGPLLVGIMSLTQPQPAAFELHLLAVARQQHRKGVGRALLAHAERRAFEQGGRFMQIKTVAASSPDPFYAQTRAFYVALGYHALFETDRLWDARNPALILVKTLA